MVCFYIYIYIYVFNKKYNFVVVVVVRSFNKLTGLAHICFSILLYSYILKKNIYIYIYTKQEEKYRAYRH